MYLHYWFLQKLLWEYTNLKNSVFLFLNSNFYSKKTLQSKMLRIAHNNYNRIINKWFVHCLSLSSRSNRTQLVHSNWLGLRRPIWVRSIESAPNNVERRKSSHKSHIMAPFRSSSFGSHLNPITTSTSGGIAQTMSLVFILRIILRIILIVRRGVLSHYCVLSTQWFELRDLVIVCVCNGLQSAMLCVCKGLHGATRTNMFWHVWFE